MSKAATAAPRFGAGTSRGSTRIELLVAGAAILALAGLVIAFLTLSRRRDESPRCLANLRQIGFCYLSYLKDNDLWMPCAGNKPTEMYDPELGEESYKPTYEVPFPSCLGGFDVTAPVYPWLLRSARVDPQFRYWYEVFQPYLDPSATVEAAIQSYNARMDAMNPPRPHLDMKNPRPALRVEQARLMRLLACPAKPDAPIGYGYNYTAPFGNSGCYPNSRDKFRWCASLKDVLNGTTGSPTPTCLSGETIPTLSLWYQQVVHSFVVTSPSTQVGWVDTGRITGNADSLDARKWQESPDSNDEGYVRFPLMRFYWPSNPDNGNSGNKVAQYACPKYAWRPAGRHGGEANCLNFDGSARPVPIGDLCSPKIQWGDPGCLFDNKPPCRPPTPCYR